MRSLFEMGRLGGWTEYGKTELAPPRLSLAERSTGRVSILACARDNQTDPCGSPSWRWGWHTVNTSL